MSIAWIWNVVTGKWVRYEPRPQPVNRALQLDRTMKDAQRKQQQSKTQ